MSTFLRTSFRRIIAVTALILALGSGDAVAQRATGIDVSRWQGTIDWTSVKGSGVTFAWAQATRGAYLVNANFTANMSNGKAAGVLMGAYHFAFPATNSPSVEADYFWAAAGPYILADGKTLMPMLDMESFTGIVGATSYSDWANQWYNNVKAKAAAVGVTIKPVMYSSACSYCNMNSSSSIFGSWVANYSGADPQTGTPWSSCSNCNLWGGGIWNFWQYSSTGAVPGISGNCDLDVFNGTAAQLSTWVATAAVADTTPPVISGVAASAINDTSATITWSTDENSDSAVDYGTTITYGFTASSPSMVLNHSIGLTGLSASTLYHYRVKSKDAANNLATSGDFTFTTLAPGTVADIIIDNPAATIVGSW
ncbi:MAG: GH25 family lysozyme, partial [Limisphaerales bacterium]